MDRYVACSLAAWLASVVVGLGGAFELWTVAESRLLVAVKIATLFALVGNAFFILRWVYRATSDGMRRCLAWLCLLSLSLCVAGDFVNFNFPGTYYQHGPLIKHDYLADSVLFFAPGYSLLLAGVLVAVWLSGQWRGAYLALFVLASPLLAAVSFTTMYIPGTNAYVSWITGGYTLLIAFVGTSGVRPPLYACGLANSEVGVERWTAKF